MNFFRFIEMMLASFAGYLAGRLPESQMIFWIIAIVAGAIFSAVDQPGK